MKSSYVVLTVIGLALAVSPTQAQTGAPWNPAQAYATREQLQDLFNRLDRSSWSPAYSEFLRTQARAQAELIRQRLEEGDFQVGDRIILAVAGEEALTGTFTVDQGQILTLSTFGDVSLTGVLRSELKDRVTEHLARFIRNPVVRARALLRVAVLGVVGQPGFYTIPGEALVTDAIMTAGGPTVVSNVNDIRVERGGDVIWEGRPLQGAMDRGLTLDQLNMRAGDRILVPQRGGGLQGAAVGARTIAILLAIPFSVVGLVQIF